MSLATGVGLISGLPINDIISQLLALRQRPILNLQRRQTDIQSQQAAFIAVNNALLTLRSAAENVSDPDSFRERSASTSNESALSVTASAGAALGSFSVNVLQLATANRIGAQGFADTDSTAVASGDGFFSFKIGSGGTVTSIAVDSTTTLADLRDAINAGVADVTASIINDGSDTNPHRLVLTSDQTGAANEIIITQNDTALNFSTNSIEAAAAATGNTYTGAVTSSGTYTGTESQRIVIEVTTGGALEAATFRVSRDGGVTFGPDDEFTASATPVDIGDGVLVDFTSGTFAQGDSFSIDVFAPEIQKAQDAVVKVDGVTLTRASNTVEDALEGITLQLNQTTAVAANVTVSQDVDLTRGRVVSFVEQYNEVVNQIAAQTAFDAETEVRGPLLGDSSIRSVQQTLARIVTSSIPGLSTSQANSLGGIGITVDNEGLLVIDNAKLDDALANDLDTVEKLFATVGASTSSKIEFLAAGAATEPGTYAVVITQPAEQAFVLGNQDIAGPITNEEILTFTVGGVDHAVTVAAGSTLEQAVESINSQLQTKGLDLVAAAEGNRLRLASGAYGSETEIQVLSDQSGSSSTQLGIGTTLRTDIGGDVVGTIGGLAATGQGQTLTGGDGTAVEGLEIFVTATSAGFVGNITVSTGVGIQLEATLESLTDAESGLVVLRQEGLGETIEDINDQIENLEDRIVAEEARLRGEFTRLEATLAQFSSTSNFLAQQLNQLSVLSAASILR
jgi:flagellar hook-associated protein 2